MISCLSCRESVETGREIETVIRLRQRLLRGALGLALLASSGCAALMSSATTRLADGVRTAVLDQDDPETVRQGAPSYLLMIDGLIAGDPGSVSLLVNGAELYSSYTTAFVDDPERAATLSRRAREYGLRGLCAADRRTCGLEQTPWEDFERTVKSLGPSRVPVLFAAGAAWATWIRVRRDDWVAVADKARVEALMQRVVELDEGYRDGAAHLYLGVLATLLPAALGGRPEEGRVHFERAVELSAGHDLTAKMLLARDYARAVYDRELHDRLLREVLAADPVWPEGTLANVLAQEEAERLLAAADDYFGE
jgi:hypothetical protein